MFAGIRNCLPHSQLVVEQGVVTTPVGQVHNVYLPEGAVIHTIKHGSNGASDDWHPAPEFDAVIAAKGEQLLAQAAAGDPAR